MSNVIIKSVTTAARALKDIEDADPLFLPTRTQESVLVSLVELRDQVEGLLLRTLAAADEVALDHGVRDAGQWLAHETRLTRAEAGRLMRLATSLRDHEEVARRHAAGELRTDQARTIVTAVDALPAELGREVRAEASAALLGFAGEHDAKALKTLGSRVLEVVAPEVAEAHEAKVLAAQEEAAYKRASFRMVDDGHGTCHGRFTLPTLQGQMLRKHLYALANPKRHDEADLKHQDGVWRAMPDRLGQALCEYIERYPDDHTPANGGLSATVVVTMDHQTLVDGLAAASLDTGHRLSPGEARRISCESGLIPAVLDGASQPLDVGRKQRLHTTAQRVALGIRDKGCTAQGCDTPPAACHAHHDHPWSTGGATSVREGRLLCPHHHRLAHHHAYETRIHADNTVTYHRRT